MIQIKDLRAGVGEKEILKGLNLDLEEGKVSVLMGPNGSGKSTLANVLMGHPKYNVFSGGVNFKGDSGFLELKPEERAKKGLFMSFQYPKEIPGVSVGNFLRTAYNSLKEEKVNVIEFHQMLREKMKFLGMDPGFLKRSLNEGFSGGEKKKSEILQLLVLNPGFAILDETDSGLDIDALKTVAKGVNSFMEKDKGILLITHYKRILDYVKADRIFVMKEGKIVLQGGKEVVEELEDKGYGWIED